MSLANKICLITNASTSFAYTIARHFGLSGAKVFLSDSNQKRLDFTLDGLRGADVPEINIKGFCANLANESDRQELFSQISNEADHLDALILTNRPNHSRGNIILSTRGELDQVFSQFVYSPFLVSQNAVPLLEKSKNASVLFISSMCAFTPFIDIGLYSAAQTALLGMNKAMAQALAAKKVRVNAIALGMFEDDGAGANWSGCSGAPIDRTAEEAKQIREAYSAVIPLGRVAKANDALGLVELLVSDRSSYITGEVFTLGGGISVRI